MKYALRLFEGQGQSNVDRGEGGRVSISFSVLDRIAVLGLGNGLAGLGERYGVVWRAEDKQTKQIVALKQLKLDKSPCSAHPRRHKFAAF